MRQVSVIILLFGVVFLGGAFVNGSGLQWVSSRTLRLLGLSNRGEITALDLESNLRSKIEPETTQALNQRIDAMTGLIVPIPSKTEDLIHKQNVSGKAMGSGAAPLLPKKVSNSGPPNQPSLLSATLSRSVMKSSSVAAASSSDEPAVRIRSDSRASLCHSKLHLQRVHQDHRQFWTPWWLCYPVVVPQPNRPCLRYHVPQPNQSLLRSSMMSGYVSRAECESLELDHLPLKVS